MSDAPGDWTYHGIKPADSDNPRIFVEDSTWGPTERMEAEIHRELLPQPGEGGVWWGYTGGSPTRAAAAILADALELPALGPGEFHGTMMHDDRTWIRLRNDFCVDVLSQLCPEWRLRRGAVLRWVRGWYAEQGITNIPAAALNLPVIDPRRPNRT